MAVTGDEWLALNLGALFPELDPNHPGSFASLARDRINQSESDLQSTIGAINNSLKKASDLVNHVRTASHAIKQAQTSLEELIHNAAATGVYTHFLGICPDFPRSLLKGNDDVITTVHRFMNDKEDPCTPAFVGDSAYLGGFLMLVGAPNPIALWDKLKVLARIFPTLQAVVKEGEEKADSTVAQFASLFNFLNDTSKSFAKDKAEFDKFEKSTASNSVPFTFNGCDKWICSTLKDLIPAFDPNKAGSPMNSALAYERKLVNGVTGAMDTFAGFSNTINKLIANLEDLQADINAFKNQVLDFGEKLAATGVYFHALGRDLSLTSVDKFVDAVSQSLSDTSDSGRPNFRGNTACMAGMLLVVGGPNATGLEKQLKNVGKVFAAFGDKYDQLNTSVGNIETNAKKFQGSLTPLGSTQVVGVGGAPPPPQTLSQRVVQAQPNVIVNKVPQFKLVNGVLVATEIDLSYSVTSDPTTPTATSDGSGTVVGQVTLLEGETTPPLPSAARPLTDGTCDTNVQVAPDELRKTAEVGEQIREGLRRLNDINSV